MSKVRLIEEAASKDWSFLTNNVHKIAAWAGVFLAPIQVLLVNIYVLVVFDLVTGIWRSWKMEEPIVSSKLRRTISKLFAYSTAILVVGTLEAHFVPDFAIMKIVAAYIGLTEVKSIFENLHDATGHDIWQILLNKIKIIQSVRLRRRPKRKARKDCR